MQKRNRFFVLLVVSLLVTGLMLAGGALEEALAKVRLVYMTAGDTVKIQIDPIQLSVLRD